MMSSRRVSLQSTLEREVSPENKMSLPSLPLELLHEIFDSIDSTTWPHLILVNHHLTTQAEFYFQDKLRREFNLHLPDRPIYWYHLLDLCRESSTRELLTHLINLLETTFDVTRRVAPQVIHWLSWEIVHRDAFIHDLIHHLAKGGYGDLAKEIIQNKIDLLRVPSSARRYDIIYFPDLLVDDYIKGAIHGGQVKLLEDYFGGRTFSSPRPLCPYLRTERLISLAARVNQVEILKLILDYDPGLLETPEIQIQVLHLILWNSIKGHHPSLTEQVLQVLDSIKRRGEGFFLGFTFRTQNYTVLPPEFFLKLLNHGRRNRFDAPLGIPAEDCDYPLIRRVLTQAIPETWSGEDQSQFLAGVIASGDQTWLQSVLTQLRGRLFDLTPALEEAIYQPKLLPLILSVSHLEDDERRRLAKRALFSGEHESAEILK